jgi:demethylsterigmatocystin 6-O-methyltransferase
LLASPAGNGNIFYGFDTLNKAFQELLPFLKETELKNPDKATDTAFHRAFHIREQFFLFIQKDPETLRYFYPSLTAFTSPVSWASAVSLDEKLKKADSQKPLFVNIGGGHGYQCDSFRKAIANRFIGRVINQGLPRTLAEAP